ncbi:MAG: DNA-binding MarR family transcriptional regulator [Halocynthiibacter sp.]|jgi:MarR family transcriptional regulator for hemolysin
MGSVQKYKLHQSLGYQLSMASRIQERRLDEGLKLLGLTRISWCVLLAVGNEGLEHPSEIAQFVGIDRTATSRVLRQMEAAGMIARSTGKSDRRMTSVRLTRAGNDALARGTPYAEDNNHIMAQRLSTDELDQLRALLEKVREGEDVPLSGL